MKHLLMVWSIFCTLVLSIACTACGGTSSGPVGSTATPQNSATSYTNDLWAIGDSAQQQNSPKHSLVEHWDGSQWRVVTSPSPGTKENILSAAAVMATNDVWAVGYFNDGQEKTLAEHWDGNRWSVSTTPNPTGFANSVLKGVAVVAPDDVWAVGLTAVNEKSPKQTLVEHWDGSQWSIVTSPSPGTKENILSALTINSTTDIWAVGYFNDGQEKTLAEHWDGSRWSVSTTPNPTGFANSILKSVQVVSAKDMWAVGDTSTTAKSPKQTLVEHWDGSQWSIVTSPSPEPGESVLLGIGRLPAA